MIFLILELFFILLFLSEKNQNLLNIQENVFANWEKYKVSWKLSFVVYY